MIDLSSHLEAPEVILAECVLCGYTLVCKFICSVSILFQTRPTRLWGLILCFCTISPKQQDIQVLKRSFRLGLCLVGDHLWAIQLSASLSLLRNVHMWSVRPVRRSLGKEPLRGKTSQINPFGKPVKHRTCVPQAGHQTTPETMGLVSSCSDSVQTEVV